MWTRLTGRHCEAREEVVWEVGGRLMWSRLKLEMRGFFNGAWGRMRMANIIVYAKIAVP